MASEKTQRFHLIYSILVSISIILAGICFIISCLNIYSSGDQPYSREVVATAFSKIAIPVYICLLLSIIGFVLDFFKFNDNTKIKPTKSYDILLQKMYMKKDLSKCSDETRALINTLRSKRKMHYIIRTILLIITSLVILIYSCIEQNFHSTDINGSMIKAMLVILPCVFISFGYMLFTIYFNERNMKKEFELIIQLPTVSTTSTNEVKTTNSNKLLVLRYVLLAIGISLLVYGFATGGTLDVLTKAVNICTECIGLG